MGRGLSWGFILCPEYYPELHGAGAGAGAPYQPAVVVISTHPRPMAPSLPNGSTESSGLVNWLQPRGCH